MWKQVIFQVTEICDESRETLGRGEWRKENQISNSTPRDNIEITKI